MQYYVNSTKRTSDAYLTYLYLTIYDVLWLPTTLSRDVIDTGYHSRKGCMDRHTKINHEGCTSLSYYHDEPN